MKLAAFALKAIPWVASASKALLVTTLMMTASPSLAGERLDVYSFNLLHFPFLGSCQQSAAWAKQRFEAATGLRALRVDCDEPWRIGGPLPANSPQRNVILQIFYEADRRLRTVANAGFDQLVSSYSSYEECRADIDRQMRLFTAQTAVPVAFAYCFWDNDDMPSRPWALAVNGFGNSSVQALQHSFDVGSIDSRQAHGIAAEVTSRLEAMGVPLIQVFVRRNPMYLQSTLHIHYYADQDIGLRQWRYDFGNLEECRSGAAKLVSFLKRSPKPALVAFCSGGSSKFSAQVISFWTTWLDIEDQYFPYTSLAACEGDEVAALRRVRQIPGSHILGTFCHKSGSSYRMSLFREFDEG